MKDEKSPASSPLAPGTLVTISPGRIYAEVASGPNSRGEYLVSWGNLSAWVHEAKLALRTGESSATRKELVKIKRRKKGAAGTSSEGVMRVDLHGLSREAAIARLDERFNDALISDVSVMEIIHGRGSGKLKETVESYLKASRHVKAFKLAEGNPGATMVYL